MPERYIDPNSGAAPQPGGQSIAPVADPKDPEKPADNVTLPGEERELSEEEKNDPTAGVTELPEDLVVNTGTHDTEVQNQAMPLDDDGGQPSGEEDLTDGDSEDDSDSTEESSDDSDDSTEESEEGDGEPAGNASKEEWVEYAKSKGASDEDLEGLGRNEIRDQYGS